MGFAPENQVRTGLPAGGRWIRTFGFPTDPLPFSALGIGGPKIRVGIDNWEAFYREAKDAWLEVKGAFYGNAGFYQPKNPVARAKDLQKTGTA